MTVLGPDIDLDPVTHDLAFTDGDLSLSADVPQAVKVRLLFIQGDWFLNLGAGLPYFERIFIKAPNLDHVSSIFRQAILDTPGVKDIVRFVPDFDPTTREYRLDWAANTDAGEIGDIETLTI